MKTKATIMMLAVIFILAATANNSFAWSHVKNAVYHLTNSAAPCLEGTAASTNRADHYNWAKQQDAATIASNLKDKINLVFKCASKTDEQLKNGFAQMSVVVAKSVPDASCFDNTATVISQDWNVHKNWAKDRPRKTIIENLQWKIANALKCLNHIKQVAFFADESVVLAHLAQ